jgi:hypothetical protein
LRGITLRIASSVLVSVVLVVFLTSRADAQSGAKALFYGPAGSTANPFAAVGIRYWFDNEQGTRFAQARDAGVGARVHMHIQSNTEGWVTVWMTDKSPEGGIQLTPDRVWPGFMMEPRRDYVLPGDITVPAAGSDTRVLILFARSQTEQVRTAAEAREKIRRLSMAAAPDGALAIVQETDTSTPGQVAAYVVHRNGAQAGVEIDISR